MKAQDGKVYKNIYTSEFLGNEIWLGCNDSEENYIEVDTPMPVVDYIEELSEMDTINMKLKESNKYLLELDFRLMLNEFGLTDLEDFYI